MWSSLDNISKKISYCSQLPFLFSGSIKNNLLYGKNEHKTTDIDLYNTLEILNIKKEIINLPQKLNTPMKMLNSSLSGGQIQRIHLTRSLLRNKEIIIFDEPTSSLDKVNEKLVLKELKKLKNEKIVIISTHKKELKSYFDKIINL